ncbi:MAG: SLBB domain-containing protein [Ignavibacteriales bacterium]|nr:SLBB domain-containing protein [Ignavibacteriales bacterium]
MNTLMKQIACFRLLCFYSFIIIFSLSFAQAQTIQSSIAQTLPSAGAASYYYIAKPGELTMQVNVWGLVKNPGRYEVSSSTDLIQLLSYAGGPADYAKMDEVKITRTVRNGSTISKQLIVLDLERIDKVEEAKLVLYPGDTIFIDHTIWLGMRDVFSVVATVAIVTTAVTQVISVSRR